MNSLKDSVKKSYLRNNRDAESTAEEFKSLPHSEYIKVLRTIKELEEN